MLQYGGNPNIRSADGMTPVLIAAAYGRYQALCMLLDRGGDPRVKDDQGQDALTYAKDSNSWDCVNILKEPWERSSHQQSVGEWSNLEDSSDNSALQTDTSSPNALQDKVISETYLVSLQGMDVTSPDNPAWFFKGSQGSTIIECAGLDKTVMCSSVNDESSSMSLGDSFVTCNDTLNKDQKRLSFSESMHSGMSSEDSDTYSVSRLENLDFDTYSVNRLPNSSVTSSLDSIINESSVSYIHRDIESNTVLLERQCPSASRMGLDVNSFSFNRTEDVTIVYDWQGYQSLQSQPQESCQIPKSLLKLTDNEIRQQLVEYGYNVGPITCTTRRVYLQRLHKLKSDPTAVAGLMITEEKQGFRFQLASYINGNMSLPPDIAELEIDMVKEFQQPEKDWREGNLKSSFNYLLLDPRVSNNLPLMYTHMTDGEAFTVFVSAIFYVGKGKRNRPYAHFNEALHHVKKGDEKQPGAKVQHILDIWGEGHGVVSLHCFQNVIPVEAYTREACMVDALGLKRLTNAIKGNYYGEATNWSPPKQRTMGVHLLKKACQIFLIEGERQIRPGDIVIGQ